MKLLGYKILSFFHCVPDPVLNVLREHYLAPGPHEGDLLLSHPTEDEM